MAEENKKPKVYIDPGHDVNDPGAVGYVVERDANTEASLAERDYLVANGVLVKMSRVNNKQDTSIAESAAEANEWGADLVTSNHANAGGGNGWEGYHSINGGKGKELAKNTEAEVKKIGQNSRGIKTRKNDDGTNTDYYGIIRLTNAPAIINEGFFVDNKADAKDFDTKAEWRELGYAYARGVLKTLGMKDYGPKGKTKDKAKTKVKSVKASAYADDYKASYAGTYVTTDALRIRHDAGTKYKVMTVLPKGTKVQCYGYYSLSKNKSTWLYVKVTLKGTEYAGFCSKQYLKKK